MKISRCLCVGLLLTMLCGPPGLSPGIQAQDVQLPSLNKGRSMVDAHNCYPDDGRWADRIERALQVGFPVGIEQDLAWHVTGSGAGRVVVSHSAETKGNEPALRDYFFERVRPIIEKELREGDRSRWPIIIVHFDFKDNQTALLESVRSLLPDYDSWITSAAKTAGLSGLSPLDVKPLLVLTEDSDAQEKIFFSDLPPGSKLRIFGSAHTTKPPTRNRKEEDRWSIDTPPERLLTERPTDYRRWWNNSWRAVEEGGASRAAAWSRQDRERLRALVRHAHGLGYWIRFYTLDGFAAGQNQGWSRDYNFGSLAAARERWRAAQEAGVDLIATDQYEQLAEFLKQLPVSFFRQPKW